MTQISRRGLVAAGTSLAAAAVPGKLRAQSRAPSLQGIDALHALPAPRKLDVAFTTADGTPRTLADYTGKGVVLNMWATWCTPCVRELPSLDELARLVAADGVVVLPVSSDHGGAAAVQAFYQAHGIVNLPVLLDPMGAMARGLNVRGIPTTLLIDGTGQEVAWLEGSADWSSSDAVSVVRKAKG